MPGQQKLVSWRICLGASRNYIEPNRVVDRRPAELMQKTLRAGSPDDSLLALPSTAQEDASLAAFDEAEIDPLDTVA